MRSRRRNDAGSVLISVMVILLIVAAGVIALTLTLHDYGRMALRNRDEMQALLIAESGLMEVVSWFNTSGTVIAHKWPYATTLFRRTTGGVFPYPELDVLLQSAGAGGLDVTTQGNGVDQLLPVVCDDVGDSKEVGRVSKLILYHTDYDPLAGTHDAIADVVAVVYSEGKTMHGTKKACYYYLFPWWLEGAPAPIVSRWESVFAGNAIPHWGEVWSAGPIASPNESQLSGPKVDIVNDPWLRYMAEGVVLFNGTWGVPTWGKPFHSETITDPLTGMNLTGDVVDGTNSPTDGVLIKGVDYTGRFLQNQALAWPTYQYERFKRLAKKKGRYFASDAAGNIYLHGYRDAAHLVPPDDIDQMLNTGTIADRSTNPDVWAEVDYDVIFIDTIDGQPPAADGSNLASIVIDGSKMSWKGFYYICGNMVLAGTGQPKAIAIKNPDGAVSTANAFVDGILNVRGTIVMEGNATVYGSVHTDMGIIGSGTMDVYYNAELADGFPVPIHPVVTAFYKVVN